MPVVSKALSRDSSVTQDGVDYGSRQELWIYRCDTPATALVDVWTDLDAPSSGTKIGTAHGTFTDMRLAQREVRPLGKSLTIFEVMLQYERSSRIISFDPNPLNRKPRWSLGAREELASKSRDLSTPPKLLALPNGRPWGGSDGPALPRTRLYHYYTVNETVQFFESQIVAWLTYNCPCTNAGTVNLGGKFFYGPRTLKLSLGDIEMRKLEEGGTVYYEVPYLLEVSPVDETWRLDNIVGRDGWELNAGKLKPIRGEDGTQVFDWPLFGTGLKRTTATAPPAVSDGTDGWGPFKIMPEVDFSPFRFWRPWE
jgi:hypothetical protein